ncbi:polysaccharide biosynthesis protein [Flavobacterium limnosediminis]|nr:nucleoside-diphosphate sugar epimerase/dehydratase [Flavobacterium limnosediminis]
MKRLRKSSVSKFIIRNKWIPISYLPRWFVFCIDIILVVLANLVYYSIVSNLNVSFYETLSLPERFALKVAAYVLFFLVFKTYSGIVRHSTLHDGFNLFKATFCTFITLAGFNYFYYFFFGKKIFLMPGLAINFFITLLFLIAFRIIVKVLYQVYLELGNQRNFEKVVVYGTDYKSVALANALLMDPKQKYKLIAFVEPRKSSVSLDKKILNIPVITYNKSLFKSIENLGVTNIIITENKLSGNLRDKAIDKCLEHGIRLLTIPSVTDWTDYKNITKSIKTFEIQDLLERKPIELDYTNISEKVSEKVILVSGAAGSIGSEMVRQLIAFKPDTVLLLDQAETPLHELSIDLQKSMSCEIIPLIADIRDKKQLEQIFKKYRPQLVFHAAAYKHVPLMEINPKQAVLTNILGTKNLADLAVQYDVSRFVMVSTDKAVNPTNIMGASKRIAEKYIQSYSVHLKQNKVNPTKFITTRFGNVLGSNGSVVPLFTKQIKEGGPVTITHPDIIRYFMTIPEACQLVLEAGVMGNGGEIFIFDMGKPVKIVDLAKKMIRLAGFTPNKEIPIEFVGLRPGEKLYEELLSDTSTTLPTHHDKIMIAKDITEDYIGVQKAIEELISVSKEDDVLETVTLMKQIVPEFKSQNSHFESLDSITGLQ